MGQNFVVLTLKTFFVAVKLQMQNLDKTFEQERKAFKVRVSDLEKKLEQVTQNLVEAESNLKIKNIELSTMEINLRELEDLREMKEVMILYQILVYSPISTGDFVFFLFFF